MNRKLLATLILVVLALGGLYAQTTGRLAGRIIDEKGQPVPYAGVVLLGTDPPIGVNAGEDGRYMLINVPIGVYDIQAQQLGYRPTTITGQRINANEFLTLNFELLTSAIEIDQIVIKGERPLIKVDPGGSREITRESIDTSPIETLEGIISLTAGATQVGGDLHVRGGRANEVVYTIDGMSVSDPVDGGSAMSIDMNAIADMKVMTGGFTAEFGNAQSGIVNIVTRDGTNVYSGSIELISDHIWNEENSNRDEIKVTIGGPLLTPAVSSLANRLTFFFNAAGQWHDTRFKNYYISDPGKDLVNMVTDFPKADPYEGRDKFWIFDLGDRNYNSYNANLKFTYRHSPTQRFSFATRIDKSNKRPLVDRLNNIDFSYAWRYALKHYAEVKEDMRQYMFTYDHTFSPQMNLTMKGSYFTKGVNLAPKGINRDDFYKLDTSYNYDRDLYMSDHDGIIFLDEIQSGVINDDLLRSYGLPAEVYRFWAYRVSGSENERGIPGFVTPGSYYSSFIDDETTTVTWRGDLEYQPDMINNIKTGLEITRHEIYKDRLFGPQRINQNRFDAFLKENGIIIDSIRVYDPTDSTIVMEEITVYDQESRFQAFKETSGTRDGYKATPWQGTFYLQDRLNFEGMIANLGLRFDFWYLGEDYQIRTEEGNLQKVNWDEITDEDIKKLRIMVSPRVGVSHPISDKAVLHFAYNYQNQLPQMQYIFTTARPIDAATSSSVVDVGNPNLEPQITVTYEVGLQRQIGDDYVFDITAYYKNIYNYVSLMKVVDDVDDTIEWYQYISEDYGSARGVDVAFQKVLSNFIAGTLSYSFAWAQGNHSGLSRKDKYTGNLREFALNWDTRHNASANVEFRIRRGEEWYIPFTDVIFPLDDLSLNFVYNIASGRPYTPMNEEGTQYLDTNSRTRPHTENASLRFTKNFRLGRKNSMSFFVSVNNLFNKKNIGSVYPVTGKHDDDGKDLSEINSDFVYPEVAHNYRHYILNPAMVGSGRGFVTGVTFAW